MTHLYFEWLYQLVCENKDYPVVGSYYKLFDLLFEKEYTYMLIMDENRADDGLDLRYRFCCENGYECSDLVSELGGKPCSVLEMIIALAVRFEEQILRDPEYGDRTSLWFWKMMENLGLRWSTDLYFNRDEANVIIDRFVHREYTKDGAGGLFYIPDCQRDLRRVEIWYQACWYFNSINV